MPGSYFITDRRMRVFVNERPVEIGRDDDVSAAVRAFDPALARRLEEPGVFVTDGRGIRIEAGAALSPGAILRVVVSARRGEGPDADA